MNARSLPTAPRGEHAGAVPWETNPRGSKVERDNLAGLLVWRIAGRP